ncbi:MAG: hypothetical protein RMK21_06010, partial [Aquificaceae bacterium]|nr:hypothetical protein [Aquificaceae bacterium]
MKKSGLFYLVLTALLILSGLIYHLQAKPSSKNLRPKSITPSVYKITPFPAYGSFVDGTDVVLYGVETDTGAGTPVQRPIIMKMGPDGTLRWSKEVTSLSSSPGSLDVQATKFGADYALVVSRAGDGFYFLKINPADGSVSASKKITCNHTPLPIDYVGVYGTELYVSGAG